jgi:hypothetical protein
MTYPDLIVLRTKRLRKIRAYTAYIVRVRPVSTLELHSSRICARHFMRVVSYNPGAYLKILRDPVRFGGRPVRRCRSAPPALATAPSRIDEAVVDLELVPEKFVFSVYFCLIGPYL